MLGEELFASTSNEILDPWFSSKSLSIAREELTIESDSPCTLNDPWMLRFVEVRVTRPVVVKLLLTR